MFIKKRKYNRLVSALHAKDSALRLAQEVIDERQAQLCAYAALSRIAIARLDSCSEQLVKLNERIAKQ